MDKTGKLALDLIMGFPTFVIDEVPDELVWNSLRLLDTSS